MNPPAKDEMELTIVMPCLNEVETVETCVKKAMQSIRSLGIAGEVVVADNGSTDGSQQIATAAGARVVPVAAKGYGSALMGGIQAARGKYIIMGDADDSYDFTQLGPFVEKLREGSDLVMGNRFQGGIQPGAMPFLHRYLGNPVLSGIGRLFFHVPVGDFHCGLRGFSKAAYARMDLHTTGMEFASEMIVKASLLKMRIKEVPTRLAPDGRSRPPHLRTWRDGWRHLRFMLLYSPRWLFLVPGLLLSALSLALAAVMSVQNITFGGVVLSVGTLMMACMAIGAGFQLTAFAFYTKIFATAEGLLPEDPKLTRLFKFFTLEKGLVVSLLVLAAGLGLLFRAVWLWKQAQFGPLPSMEDNLRRIIPAATLILLGVQGVFSCFFLSVLGMKTTKLNR